MFRNGAKLFPPKGVFKVSWNNCFEMTKKGPITAPSGMIIYSRAENMDKDIRNGFLRTVWIMLIRWESQKYVYQI